MKNYCVLVPCYNEEKAIKEIIQKLKHYHYDFLIIDDNSTDKSLNIIKKETSNYLTYSINKGKGFAIKKAVKYLKSKNYNWFVIFDADGQINIKDINNLLKLKDLYPNIGILIGDRLNNPVNMPFLRLLANKIMSWIISLLAKQHIKDSQCGLKIIKKEVFKTLDLKTDRFDFETELLVKAGRKGYKIVNGEIRCIYFKGRISKINYLKDWYRFVKLILTLIFKLDSV